MIKQTAYLAMVHMQCVRFLLQKKLVLITEEGCSQVDAREKKVVIIIRQYKEEFIAVAKKMRVEVKAYKILDQKIDIILIND